MAPLGQEEFVQHIELAKSRKSADYSQAANVIAFCAERQRQCSLLLIDELKGDVKAKVLRTLMFFTGVVGRIAELEGAQSPALYNGYKSHAGNQVDIFLKEIGFVRNKNL